MNIITRFAFVGYTHTTHMVIKCRKINPILSQTRSTAATVVRTRWSTQCAALKAAKTLN